MTGRNSIPAATGRSAPETIGNQGNLLDRIAYFERLSSIVKSRDGLVESAQSKAAERLQSSACFDSWAMPDPDPFNASRH